MWRSGISKKGVRKEVGEMKSAFEKAMEKAEKLGSLSPEEMRERKEAEYTTLGRAIAERYMGHGHKQLLKEEVGQYSGEEKAVVSGGGAFQAG